MIFPLKDNIPSRTTPVVTIGLITVNVIIFLFELSLGPDHLQQLFYVFGIVPTRVHAYLFTSFLKGALPFLTFQFLHGGFMHLLGNMWFLWLFGVNVEDRMGHFKFLLFYLAAGVMSGLIHLMTLPPCGNAAAMLIPQVLAVCNAPVIGASGAIAGVMGAYFLMYPTAWIKVLLLIVIIPVIFYVPAIVFLPVWFLSQAVHVFTPLGRQSYNVAWGAHVGGFIFGMLAVPFLAGKRPRPLVQEDRNIL